MPTKAKATYEDLLAVPDDKVAELIDGELFVTPRPAIPHAWASSQLGADLIPPFMRGADGPGGWIILDEPELHFGTAPEALVPDLAGWRRERLAAEALTAAFITVAPDWACEVVSPSTEQVDRARKMPVYLREGVQDLWLINPLLRTLEVFARQDAAWLLTVVHSKDAVVQVPPFEARPLDLSRLWIRSESSL